VACHLQQASDSQRTQEYGWKRSVTAGRLRSPSPHPALNRFRLIGFTHRPRKLRGSRTNRTLVLRPRLLAILPGHDLRQPLQGYHGMGRTTSFAKTLNGERRADTTLARARWRPRGKLSDKLGSAHRGSPACSKRPSGKIGQEAVQARSGFFSEYRKRNFAETGTASRGSRFSRQFPTPQAVRGQANPVLLHGIFAQT